MSQQTNLIRVISVVLFSAACGRTAVAPSGNEAFYQPLAEQDVPRIEILSPLDSESTAQQPMNLEDALQLSAGTWPFSWTPIDGTERYVLYVYDFTRATEEYREGASPYAEIETTETSANVELEAGSLYLFEVAAFDGFELIGKSQAWALRA